MQTVSRTKETNEYVVGIDIGSSMVVMAVGRRNDDGTMNIVAIETSPTGDAVRNGMIDNHVRLGQTIKKIKDEIEGMLNITLDEAYVGMSGNAVYMATCSEHVYVTDVNNHCISKVDIANIEERIAKVPASSNSEIMERIPINYVIDDNRNVQGPIGYCATKLSAQYLFICCKQQQKMALENALMHAGMHLKALCANAAVVGDALLSDEEKRAGAAIVNIGHHLTDVSIFRDGHLCYMSSMPIGSEAVSQDLKTFLQLVSDSKITQIKHGAACAAMLKENEVSDSHAISVGQGGGKSKKVLVSNIIRVAEARMKDIVKFTMEELKFAKYSQRVPYGIILIGGGAQLNYTDELFNSELSNIPVRMAKWVNGFDADSQEKMGAVDQYVAASIVRYGNTLGPCRTLVKEEIVVPPAERDDWVNTTGVGTTDVGTTDGKPNGVGTADGKPNGGGTTDVGTTDGKPNGGGTTDVGTTDVKPNGGGTTDGDTTDGDTTDGDTTDGDTTGNEGNSTSVFNKLFNYINKIIAGDNQELQ